MPATPPFNAEFLRSVLSYAPETGTFTWLDSGNRGIDGSEAGSISLAGYRMIKVRGRSYGGQRLAWLYAHGVWPEQEVDHIDRNPLNNALSNLRLATKSQNQMNRTAKMDHGFKGITYHPRHKRWMAQISIKNRNVNLGRYKTMEEAARAYDARARAEHGQFAVLNFPGP